MSDGQRALACASVENWLTPVDSVGVEGAGLAVDSGDAGLPGGAVAVGVRAGAVGAAVGAGAGATGAVVGAGAGATGRDGATVD